jgi:hypothetical protein
MSGIGLLNEKSLHASLKEWYAQPDDQFEVPVDGFFIDIVRDEQLLEIQTRNLAAIKSKVQKLAGAWKIRLIYPIAQEKWIVKLAKNGRRGSTRRKSPKRGRIEDVFWEMVSFPSLLTHPNFSLEVVMIQEEEVRRFAGRGRWRRKGWAIEERRLLGVVGQKVYQEPADWRTFVPPGLEEFTTSDLAAANGITRSLAQRMAYCLRHAEVIRLAGKVGRANSYRII